MLKSSFNDGGSLRGADVPVTIIRDIKEDTYEMEPVPGKATVAEQYRGTSEDQDNMRVLGRTQELRRIFNFTSIIGFSSTLICTWEVILATLSSSLTNGGTAGLFWGYLFVAIGLFLVYLSLAELASMAPTSGGQYHWVSEFSPRSCQKYLSYLTGWLCFIGWQCGVTAISFMSGTIIQGLIVLNNESYVFQPWHGTLLAIAITALCVFFNTVLASRLPIVEGILLVLHISGLFAIAIPLWVLAPSRTNAKAAFTQFTNNGGWSSNGTSFFMGLNVIIVSLLGLDSAVHMSEEVKDASRTLPRAIVWSKSVNALSGLFMVITIIFNWGNMDEIIMTPTGYPFIQVFYNVTHSLPATNVMVAIVVIALISSAIAITATASRQTWSFARDNGTPFSRTIAHVMPSWSIPLNAVLISLGVTSLLSLINLGSYTALNAILSLGVAATLSSYMISIICLTIKRLGNEPLPPRRWSLGKSGLAVNVASIVFLLIMWVFSFFPAMTPATPQNMNWGSLMYGSVVIFATGYYLVIGRKVYISPLERVHRELQR